MTPEPQHPGTVDSDEILREVWRARDALSASCGHDLHKLVEMLRREQAASGHVVVNLQSERPASPDALVLGK